jgi:hypothetical protein
LFASAVPDIVKKPNELKSLVSIIAALLLLSFLAGNSFSQLVASGDTTICQGGQAQLSASGGGVSYFWSSYPTDPSLLIPQQQNPVVSPQVSTMYVVQSNIATGNLILNGAFELGVMGFNSEYVNNQASIVAEGTYAVVNDAHTVHPNFFCNQDHTTGSGKFMAVNGAGVANVKVWYLTLNSVQPGVRYEFSTWITSLHETNPAILQFSINGELMGQPFQAYPYTCTWYQFFHLWDSGENDQATISIVNQNTILSGNDFALDDISFATVLVYYDTVWVEVLPQFNSPFEAPDFACTRELVTVDYTGNAPDTADFHWDFDGGTILSGSGPGPYEITYLTPGNPVVSLWVEGDGCASGTTTHPLLVGDAPEVSLTADNTILPYGSSTLLHGSYEGGAGPFSFEWSPAELLVDAGTLDPQTLALEFTTSFILAVTDHSANCTGYDTLIIQVAGGPLVVNLQATPSAVCAGEQSVLTAQGFGGTENYTYSWSSNPPGFMSDLPTVIVQPSITTNYTITIGDGLSSASESVTVTVHPVPLAFAGENIIIPYGTSTSLQGNCSGGSGSYAYRWEPASLVADPNSAATSTVNLVSTTVFTLFVTDQISSCNANPDEVIVQIEGGPLAVIIYTDKPSVCQGEAAILSAFASGGNQGNYTYAWNDNLGNFYPSTQQISVSPEVTSEFHVVINDGFNTVEAFFTLIVYPSAEFGWAHGPENILACPADTVLLKPEPKLPGWTYLWSNGSAADQITVGVTGIGFSLQTYTLTVTSIDGCTCSKSVTVTFDFAYCSGMGEDVQNDPIRIIPNPNKGIFKLYLDNRETYNGLMIFSPVSGKSYEKTISGKHAELEIDLKHLPPGLYVLCLKGATGMTSRKILILP